MTKNQQKLLVLLVLILLTVLLWPTVDAWYYTMKELSDGFDNPWFDFVADYFRNYNYQEGL